MTNTGDTLQIAESHAELDQFFAMLQRSQSSALLLDYDGTLAPFSVDRLQAFPYPGLAALLREIWLSGRTRLAIITGRSAEEVASLLQIDPTPEIWGSHGLQHLRPNGTNEIPPLDPVVMQALSDAEAWLRREKLQDLAEIKPGGIAVHWRGLPKLQVEEIRRRVLLGWFPIAQQSLMSILEFDGGVEIRTPELDKGDAVRTVIREMRPDAPIAYLGDDATDERAFCALGSRGLSVLVRPVWRKTSARLWLKPPGELLEFLTRWEQALSWDRDGK
jgi:trehalose 6-phosphate phosphatase